MRRLSTSWPCPAALEPRLHVLATFSLLNRAGLHTNTDRRNVLTIRLPYKFHLFFLCTSKLGNKHSSESLRDGAAFKHLGRADPAKGALHFWIG